ncbi:threonine-phosphate decarboxylase [Salmonella enterica]|nr:threonine-phosphate decarboxylase [Salmonella enterica subsp. enterica serovar Kentucky]ECT0443850.1 threonine-phosphate decarboxylase [Salmonella enterica subsp. enterica serovar Kentucky]EDD3170729.1 threonine-phosphate decarboxylase [Salmonella enterica subsp. enterica serovar Kentucky]EDJ7984547.1 threonine-phosphate decarboxylase [Salmonella enterica subsp. enterica serovar Kentucky]EFQ4386147.1 threonine-phosphate decarboxylase [Salmonella enterica subsp. enterica serovar Kentucky]
MALFNSAHGGNIREAATVLGISPDQLLDFSANINPLGMPVSVKRALIDNLDCIERYPDADYFHLHQALARHHQVPASWILAGNGETESIFTVASCLKPRRAMIVTPGFAEYGRALAQIGCEIRRWSLREADGWQLTDAILEALTPDLDCLFLCTPNNPTGLLPERQLLQAIVDRCKSLNINLILDEAFIDFIPHETGFIPALKDNPHIWVLRSLTKFYAIPGLRLGYLVNSDDAAVARMRRQQMPWSVNALAALAGEVALQDSAWQQATWHWLREEGARFYQALCQLPLLTVYPGRANYLLLRCEREDIDLQRRLLTQRILIRSCANYPGLDSRYYRVAIRSAAQNERLLSALRNVLTGITPAD